MGFPKDLELQVVVSSLMWVLGIEPRFSGGAVYVLTAEPFSSPLLYLAGEFTSLEFTSPDVSVCSCDLHTDTRNPSYVYLPA